MSYHNYTLAYSTTKLFGVLGAVGSLMRGESFLEIAVHGVCCAGTGYVVGRGLTLITTDKNDIQLVKV